VQEGGRPALMAEQAQPKCDTPRGWWPPCRAWRSRGHRRPVCNARGTR
jgi:hypothetical protein